MTLGSDDISEEALRVDDRVGLRRSPSIGIPSAFLLHGYVGFIFGSVKANPWWSTPLMPIVFLFSAIVSGIAPVMLLYMAITRLRGLAIDMRCVDTIARYLFYAFIIDFSLEMLDLIHRIYEADESFQTLDFMVQTQLYVSQIIVQIVLGTLVPLGLLALTQLVKLTEAGPARHLRGRRRSLTLVGIFAMRWNVVIGGQLFSKSFLGYTTYKMEFATREGLLPAILLMILPFVILWVLVKLLPPWADGEAEQAPARLRRAPWPIACEELQSAVQELAASLRRLEARVGELERRGPVPARAGGDARGEGAAAPGPGIASPRARSPSSGRRCSSSPGPTWRGP